MAARLLRELRKHSSLSQGSDISETHAGETRTMVPTHLLQVMYGTVIIVDDDAAVRKSLSRLLTSASYHVVTFESVRSYMQSNHTEGPTCILLDLQMPHATGLDLQSELRSQDYHPPIVFLSGHADVHSSVEAMKNGAVDFLEKPVGATLLLATIDRAIKKDATGRVARVRRNLIYERTKSLTGRQHEVLTHVIAGRLNKQIAIDLGISEKTVKAHRGRVTEKMCARSVAELTRQCDEIGVVPAYGP